MAELLPDSFAVDGVGFAPSQCLLLTLGSQPRQPWPSVRIDQVTECIQSSDRRKYSHPGVLYSVSRRVGCGVNCGIRSASSESYTVPRILLFVPDRQNKRSNKRVSHQPPPHQPAPQNYATRSTSADAQKRNNDTIERHEAEGQPSKPSHECNPCRTITNDRGTTPPLTQVVP